jgi:hypothetical protein
MRSLPVFIHLYLFELYIARLGAENDHQKTRVTLTTKGTLQQAEADGLIIFMSVKVLMVVFLFHVFSFLLLGTLTLDYVLKCIMVCAIRLPLYPCKLLGVNVKSQNLKHT